MGNSVIKSSSCQHFQTLGKLKILIISVNIIPVVSGKVKEKKRFSFQIGQGGTIKKCCHSNQLYLYLVVFFILGDL